MSIRRTLLCLAVLVIAVPAFAQPSKSRRGQFWQVSLQTRYTPSQSIETKGGSGVEIEDDMGWGFGFEYNFNPKLSLGAGFTWRNVPYLATLVDAGDPTVTEKIPSEFDITVMEARGTWHFTDTTLAPFVNGSWGWMLVDSNIYAGSQADCWWHPWYGLVCDVWSGNYGANTWTAGLGGGVRWEPGRDSSFFMKAAYEYLWSGEDLIGAASIFKLEFGLLM